MAEENNKEEAKKILEREYVVPLRREWLKVQKYKRATKAVKALKEFLARHMKVYDRDLRKIKVDILLNNEIRFRGMRKPAHKIKVKAVKFDNGEVRVYLAELPKHIEFEIARKARKEAEKLSKEKVKPEAPKAEEKEEPKEEKKEEKKEKIESSKIAGLAMEKQAAKIEKHTSKTQQQTPKIQRKALKK